MLISRRRHRDSASGPPSALGHSADSRRRLRGVTAGRRRNGVADAPHQIGASIHMAVTACRRKDKVHRRRVKPPLQCRGKLGRALFCFQVLLVDRTARPFMDCTHRVGDGSPLHSRARFWPRAPRLRCFADFSGRRLTHRKMAYCTAGKSVPASSTDAGPR